MAAPAFKKYFEHSVSEGTPQDPELAWKLLDLYMDLLIHSSKWDDALLSLRSLGRWILGRTDEKFWDEHTQDDREWDFEDEPRRTELSAFVPGRHPIEAYGEGLPLELRQKLGLIRLGLGADSQSEALVSS